MSRFVVLVLAAVALAGCGGGSDGGATLAPAPQEATRSWQMGFAPTPPRLSAEAVIAGIDRWSLRAELAAIHEEVPWRELLSGVSPETILARDKVQLVNYLRSKGLALYFMADPTDGLSRSEEAPQLRALGRSLTEPQVQAVYRAYVLAVARQLNPEYIGLAAETNLVRLAAPPALYAALVQTANAAAAELRAAGAHAKLISSVQVETAWGRLGGNGIYSGIERDLADFAFADILGLSSYPYFGYARPEDLPTDYYVRLLGGRNLPVMVVEGGWTSGTAGTIRSTPELQSRYVAEHARLLDAVRARAVIQLLFANLDLASWPPPIPENLPLFAELGLVDSDFNPKPALAAWDALHRRRFQP